MSKHRFEFVLLLISIFSVWEAAFAQSTLPPSVGAMVSADCEFSYVGSDRTDILTLQRARARIIDPQKTARQRSACGATAAQQVEAFFGCTSCAREIVGLLKDAAAMQRRSADKYKANPSNLAVFLTAEIKVRQALETYLRDYPTTPDSSISERRSNLAAMADAYEHSEAGRQFHDFVASQSVQGVLGQTAFTIWARAIRSCSDWNFVAGQNRLNRSVLATEICNDKCLAEYKLFERYVAQSGDQKIQLAVESFLPSRLCDSGVSL